MSNRAPSGTPAPTEMSPAHRRFLDLIVTDDIASELEKLTVESLAILTKVPGSRETFRYAPGKWSLREVVGHVTDCERIFCARMVALSRGDQGEIRSFDEDLYAANAGHDEIPLFVLIEEFAAVRKATMLLLAQFNAVQWRRSATIADHPRSCRSVAWSVAGHSIHHFRFLQERYLTNAS